MNVKSIATTAAIAAVVVLALGIASRKFGPFPGMGAK